MGDPIYAVGDIHGQAEELDRVLSLIEADGGTDARVVFLGDYTDRGPDSQGVLDRLIEGRAAGRNWTFLMGNHDRMFRLFLQSPPQEDPHMMVELYWLHPRLGGDTTLSSYGVPVAGTRRVKDVHADALEAVPEAHMAFLEELELSFETEGLFFCHAGIRPGVPLAAQSEEDLIWIRTEFHEVSTAHPKLIVHGHTPVQAATHYGNRVNLDTGAGYGRPLAACVFEAERCFLLGPDGRAALEPTRSA
jgi:serine/threonine protein phosphatase 1